MCRHWQLEGDFVQAGLTGSSAESCKVAGLESRTKPVRRTLPSFCSKEQRSTGKVRDEKYPPNISKPWLLLKYSVYVDNNRFSKHRRRSFNEILLVSWRLFVTTAGRFERTLTAPSTWTEIGKLCVCFSVERSARQRNVALWTVAKNIGRVKQRKKLSINKQSITNRKLDYNEVRSDSEMR